VTVGIALSGATSRLLPRSIPFRFFGTAVALHVCAWIALLAGAASAPRFAGGLGWPLAALHLATLGVLVMTAIGASLQLLPVATRQPVRWPRAAAAIWWLYTPGVVAATLGMGCALPALLVAGGVCVALALALYALLLGANLKGARGMPAVVAHGWAALASLVVVLITALALALSWLGMPLFDRSTALVLHVAFGAYGFMGMLACGLSYVLIPMFALAPAPDERAAFASLALGVSALFCTALAAFGMAPAALRVIAVVAGMAAVAIHLVLMALALRRGMRRELGRSFRLVRLAWAMLAASLCAALAQALGLPFDGLATLFGLLLVGGWLLTFALGVLQRIAPFLASMHTARGSSRTRTPSSLTAEFPLAIFHAAHLAALALLFAALLLDSPPLMMLAAGCGVVSGSAYAAFFVIVLLRMTRPEQPRQALSAV
jgi:hypothetical protein